MNKLLVIVDMKNDFIDIEESTVGGIVSMRLDELMEFNSSVSFTVNGMNITCPRYAYVNGNIETGTYIIRLKEDGIPAWKYFTLQGLSDKTFNDFLKEWESKTEIRKNNDAIGQVEPIIIIQ